MHDRPLARSEGIISEWVDDDLVIYDEANQTGHSLTSAAAAVWQQCTGDRSQPEIAQALGLEPALVDRALAELDEVGLLDGGPDTSSGVSRREVTRRLAQVGGAALAAPLIYSVAVPAAAAAASCTVADGSTVTSSHCNATAGNFGTSTGSGNNCCASGTCYRGRFSATYYCVAASETCVVYNGVCTSSSQCCYNPSGSTCSGGTTKHCSQ